MKDEKSDKILALGKQMDQQQAAEKAVDEILGKAIDVVSLDLPHGQIWITMKNGTVVSIFKGEGGELRMELD